MKPSEFIKREITTDKDAQTVVEIADESGLANSTVRLHIREMVKAGKWKEVYKRTDNGRIVRAYIGVRK
jgi:predicted transcriptional regulator